MCQGMVLRETPGQRTLEKQMVGMITLNKQMVGMIDIQMPNKDLYTNNLTLRWFALSKMSTYEIGALNICSFRRFFFSACCMTQRRGHHLGIGFPFSSDFTVASGLLKYDLVWIPAAGLVCYLGF